MANYQDFLVALDAHISQSSLGYVIYGHEMHQIAAAAGLVGPGDQSATRWTGELVEARYLTHGPLSAGDPRPMPRGWWTDSDLARVSDYRITYEGRTEADRIRRQRREAMTDAALGLGAAALAVESLDEGQRMAVSLPLSNLRSALDNQSYPSAVGAAKDLVEAAAKLAIARAGAAVPTNASLPTLVKTALEARSGNSAGGKVASESGEDLARRLAAAVQSLAELRNTVGTGHGRAVQPHVSCREGHLAASTACAIASFLLDAETP